MSGAAETGATFAVKSGPTTVLSGSVGADLGSWSNLYSHVYAIDFDSLTTAGTYTIAVSGPAPATSVPRASAMAPSSCVSEEGEDAAGDGWASAGAAAAETRISPRADAPTVIFDMRFTE